jgi:hypothetical protein
MERVLVALVFAAICAVLYYVQLYWVSIMQCLLAFVLFTICDVSAFKFSEQRRSDLSDYWTRAVRCEPGVCDRDD